MINLEDIDPPKTSKKPKDLQPLSIAELKEYIADLEQEIARAEDAIQKKEAHRKGVDALFGKP